MNASAMPTKAIVMQVCVLSLSGCMGNLGGTMRGQGGKVTISGADSGYYTVTLPDGETFQGPRMLMQKPNLGGLLDTLVEPPAIRSPFGDVVYFYDFLRHQRAITYGGTLSGNRGHRMWCNIFATGFGGGKGLCDISDGRTVDLEW